MRLAKILIPALVTLVSVSCRAQYVQPMGYKDYSFWSQVNIGNLGAKLTHPSAYLELGKASGSNKALLLPRGNKDSVSSPAYGDVFYNISDSLPYFFNGSAWVAFSGGTGGSGGNNYVTGLSYSSNLFTLSRSGLSNLTVTLPFSSKLNIGDTTGKWIYDIYSRGDSVFYKKGGLETFVFSDSAIGGSWVPTARKLNINGIQQDLSADRSWGPFLVPADTVWLHNQIVNTNITNLTFSGGLLRTGNSVIALKDNAVWNAEKIQGFSVAATLPTNGQVLAYNTTNNRYEPTAISGSGIAGSGTAGQMPYFDGVTSIAETNIFYYHGSGDAMMGINTAPSTAHLQIEASDAADFIQASRTGLLKFSVDQYGGIYSYNLDDGTGVAKMVTVNNGVFGYSAIPAGGGATPTLQQVTDAGNTTTNSLLLNNATLSHSAINSSIAFGKYNLGSVTTGKHNVAIGDSALTGITTGSWNTALGYQTLESTTTGYANTAIGRWALEGVTTGYSNTAVGANAADLVTTGFENVVIGHSAGYWLSTGSYNTLIGTLAGASIRTGSYNTIIGATHGALDSDYNHRVIIGDGLYDRLHIDSVGSWKLYTYGSGTHTGTATYAAAFDASGNLIETALGGGGGGSTPGIDDVLTIGQALSTNRIIDLNSHTLTLDNASSITSALLFKNTGTTGIYMPNTSDIKLEASGGGSMTVQGNGFIKTPYYGFPTGSFHMNTGTFNGVATYWNTSGVLIEKAAGATNIISKTFSNNGDEVYPFQGTIKVDATSGNTTLILGDPADGGFDTGGIMRFIKTDASANTVTIDAWTNWSATVNGVHTKTLTAQWQYIVVQSDGTNWYVVGGN